MSAIVCACLSFFVHSSEQTNPPLPLMFVHFETSLGSHIETLDDPYYKVYHRAQVPRITWYRKLDKQTRLADR